MKKEIKKLDILKRPEYPGGQKALRHFIGQNLRYPPSALEAKVEGTVHLRYAIDHQGKVGDIKIIRSVGHGCDEEAIRLVRLLEFHVAKTRGVKVLYHKTLQIHFRLPASKPEPVQQSFQIHYQLQPTKPASPPSKQKPGKSFHYSIGGKDE